MKLTIRMPLLLVAASFVCASPALARIKVGDSATYKVTEGINSWDETHEVIEINEWEAELKMRITRVGSAGTNSKEITEDLEAARITESLFDNCVAPHVNGKLETYAAPGGDVAVCHLQFEDPNSYDTIEAWVAAPDVLPQGIAKKIVGSDDPSSAKTYELKAYLKY